MAFTYLQRAFHLHKYTKVNQLQFIYADLRLYNRAPPPPQSYFQIEGICDRQGLFLQVLF